MRIRIQSARFDPPAARRGGVETSDFDSELDDLVDRTLERAGRSARKRAALGTLRRRTSDSPAGGRRSLGSATT